MMTRDELLDELQHVLDETRALTRIRAQTDLMSENDAHWFRQCGNIFSREALLEARTRDLFEALRRALPVAGV